MDPTFKLNQSIPLLVPDSRQVVQVIVRHARVNLGVLVAFMLAHNEIKTSIHSIVNTHLLVPFPPSGVVIEGNGYTLRGEPRAWLYARKWEFELQWGMEEVAPARDKWVFWFAPSKAK